MALVVHKYGGTSVGSIDRIKVISEHITSTVKGGDKLVVVVSAMGKHTNELCSLAYQLSSTPAKRELDMLLTVGERISMSLLSIALQDQGLKAISFTGSQCGIITDGTHGNARITRITGERIRSSLDQYDVVIVAGFQGVSETTKEVTTLGRGGSDLSAVALTKTLDAERCEIYTDVNGICTANPSIVRSAKTVSQISWDVMCNLSWHGASVLHPRAAHLAHKYKIPLYIRSSFDLACEGTLIQGPNTMEQATIQAISHKEDQCITEITSPQPTLSRCLEWLWKEGETPLINQEEQTSQKTFRVRQMVPKSLVEKYLSFAQSLGAEFKVTHDNIASISVVGHGFFQNPELVQKISGPLVKHLKHLATSDSTITMCIDQSELKETLKMVHDKCMGLSK